MGDMLGAALRGEASPAALLVLALLAWCDARARRLPFALSGALLAVGLGQGYVAAGGAGTVGALLAGGVVAAPLWALGRRTRRKGPRWRVGGGDAPFAFALGAAFGLTGALPALAAGAAIAGLAGLATGRPQPLGAWVAAALALSWLEVRAKA